MEEGADGIKRIAKTRQPGLKPIAQWNAIRSKTTKQIGQSKELTEANNALQSAETQKYAGSKLASTKTYYSLDGLRKRLYQNSLLNETKLSLRQRRRNRSCNWSQNGIFAM